MNSVLSWQKTQFFHLREGGPMHKIKRKKELTPSFQRTEGGGNSKSYMEPGSQESLWGLLGAEGIFPFTWSNGDWLTGLRSQRGERRQREDKSTHLDLNLLPFYTPVVIKLPVLRFLSMLKLMRISPSLYVYLLEIKSWKRLIYIPTNSCWNSNVNHYKLS